MCVCVWGGGGGSDRGLFAKVKLSVAHSGG